MEEKFSVWIIGGDTSNLGSNASTTGCLKKIERKKHKLYMA